jgi:hypothetical protein
MGMYDVSEPKFPKFVETVSYIKDTVMELISVCGKRSRENVLEDNNISVKYMK